MSKSITWKLWSVLVFFLLIIFALIISIQSNFLKNHYCEQLKNELTKHAEILTGNVQAKGITSIQQDLEEVAKNIKGSAVITDRFGKILNKAGQGNYAEDDKYPYNLLMQAIHFQRVEKIDQITGDEEEVFIIGLPIIGNIPQKYIGKEEMVSQEQLQTYPYRRVIGTVFLHASMDPINEIINTIKKQLMWIAFITLLLSIAFIYFIDKIFSRPLLEMNRVTMDLTSGNYNEIVNVKRKDEIGHLAENINKLSQRLYAVERVRKDFVANISHELRTPLSLMRGYTEVVLDGIAKSKEEEEKYLHIVVSEIERMQHLVSDLLDLSQIDAGFLKVEKQAVSIDRLIQHVVNALDALLKEKDLKLHYNINNPNLLVWADEYRMHQVLINLLNNSITHTPPGGRIYITVVEYEKKVKVCLRDTGKGILKKDIPFIWERFYKGDRSRSENKDNLGIGLAIVKNILSAHGSNVTVESEIGIGTEICFTLSLYKK